MDATTYKEAIEYELLTQSIYQSILHQEGVHNIEVKHNVPIRGRSGVDHQIDVLWEFKQAGLTHLVLIECKNYASNLSLEKTRNFFSVLHDIGNCGGIMVTKTGYQRGAADFSKYYGISLKVLREPNVQDWKNRIKTININVIPRVPVSTEDHPIIASMYLRPSSDEQEIRLKNATEKNPSLVQADPSLFFVDENNNQCTEEMRWWIPRQLNVLEYKDGGPYEKKVKLDNHYISVEMEQRAELVQVIGIVIEFYVETQDSEQIVIDAALAVSSILKDFESGEWEFVHKNTMTANNGWIHVTPCYLSKK